MGKRPRPEAHSGTANGVGGHSPGMASWLMIALVLILLGLIFGVGLFVEAGKVILIVLLVLLLIGVLIGGFRRTTV